MRAYLIKIITTLSCVSACTSPPPLAPVQENDQPPSLKVRTHVVARGETLYSISWRYNLDVKQLANANKIGSKYTIYPGQRLSLDVADASRALAKQTSPPRNLAAPVVKKERKIPRAKVIRPVNIGKSPSHAKSTSRIKKSPPSKTKKPTNRSSTKGLSWIWPAKGPVVHGFNGKSGLNKGIDIGGNLGEPIVAAADGVVVYSGSGLRGYGRLIIIKHSQKFLSAYAHNEKILVKESDSVKAGQKIARMGNTGTDSVKLHFEIRYDGKPSDPAKYLPKR